MIGAYERGYRVLDNGDVCSPTGKILSTYIVVNMGVTPYRRITLRSNDQRASVSVHQLAAYQLYGKASLKRGIEVRHLDNNSLNNELKNIAIGTQQQNTFDKPKKEISKLQHTAMLAAIPVVRKLTDCEVDHLRQLRSRGATYGDLMAIFGIAKSTVSYIVRGITYKRKLYP